MHSKNLKIVFSLVLIMFGLSLVSCLKKRATYTVRISASNENTAKVWRDTMGQTEPASSTMQQNNNDGKRWNPNAGSYGFIDSLASAKDFNANNAQIDSVQVSYTNKQGKSANYEAKDLPIGTVFSKEYEV